MKKKTILVTGGAGFIGSHLCKYLLEMNIMLFVLIIYLPVQFIIFLN